MTAAEFHDELRFWINGDPEREALMIKEAPIKKSTLGATLRGRYNPGERLEKAIRHVMEKYPLRAKKKTAV